MNGGPERTSYVQPRQPWLIGAFAAAFLMVLMNAAVGYHNIRTVSNNEQWVAHTRQVLQEISALRVSSAEVQRGLWGYIVNGRQELLHSSDASADQLGKVLDRIEKLTKDNPAQQSRVKELRAAQRAFSDYEAQARSVAAVSREQATRLIADARGLVLLQPIDLITDQIAAEEARLLAIRQDQSQRSLARAYTAFIVGNAITLIAITWLAGVTIRNLRERHLDAARIYDLMQEVRRRADELEATVDRRTRELRESNTALEAFSYSVSHDLKEPLRSMAGLAYALGEDHASKLEDEARSYLSGIIDSAKRMDRLINNFLAYARLTRGDLPLSSVNLEQVLSDVRREFTPKLQAVHAQLEVASPLPPVCANRAALTQVVANLLSNSIKFVAPGTSPRIRCWSQDAGDCVRFWVADNGLGIAPEDREKVFEPFHRIHGGGKESGNGVGLAIVRQAIERMGGRVGIAAHDGAGTRLWLELQKG